VTYVIAQVLGAIAGAAVLYLILSGKASGWRDRWARTAGALFLVCILGVTQRGVPVGIGGLAIGLTLVAIHALEQVRLFIAAPLIGARLAGSLFKSGSLSAEDIIPERGVAKFDGPRSLGPRKRS
jgi:aquaporin Z